MVADIITNGIKVIDKPGHGYPVVWVDDDQEHRFPSVLLDMGDEAELEVFTLRELTMMRFINQVTDKPEWTEKVFDENIVNKWRGEAIIPGAPFESEISEKMFNYCISELRYLAERHRNSPNGAIKAFTGDVFKSDTAVPHSTRLALQQAVAELLERNVPESQKDWHPGTDNKVLDLVHPSLFPLIYATSRILPVGADVTTLEDCIRRCGEGETIDDPEEEDDFSDSDTHSGSFQWLPCEVDISGDRPKILTYINNLHPQRHRDLYPIIEDIIAASVPLWDLTLAPHRDGGTLPRRLKYEVCEYDPDPEQWPNSEKPPRRENESNDYYSRLDIWYRDTRRLVLPEPPEKFEPLEEPEPFSLKESYGKLQIIVKLANIELTPDKPEYEGGSWHVEGKLNEAICASALYYYSSENISPSSLSFRQQSCVDRIQKDVSYEQYDHDWLPAVFGFQVYGGTSIQLLGSLQTTQGRLITFPNILQHQVQPFKLQDPTRPGHRKLLALFLVDPNHTIISTADVPCQRADWWREDALALINGPSLRATDTPLLLQSRTLAGHSTLGKGATWKNLPLELQEEVFKFAGEHEFPISVQSAERYREELMNERRAFVLAQQASFSEEVEISLCEH